MNIKLDENMPAALVDALQALGHDADTVPQQGIAGRDDRVVWNAAQRAGRLLITQDLDFSDVRRYRPGTHCDLLLVRLRKPGRAALTARVSAAFETEQVQTWQQCFVVLTDHKLRIRRP